VEKAERRVDEDPGEDDEGDAAAVAEGPPGFFLPISHFCTVETLVLSTAAKTAWLSFEFSRISLILRAPIASMARWLSAS
jgi:hypothetical protein